VAALLKDLGYRVIQARDGEVALGILQSGIPIDLLLSDVIMPGPLKSTDLARKARAQIPGLPVLFTSGYPEKALVQFDRQNEQFDLLSKPYSRETLARTLRHVLARGATTSMATSVHSDPSTDFKGHD
jgi:CheY-like chemotaxis protein